MLPWVVDFFAAPNSVHVGTFVRVVVVPIPSVARVVVVGIVSPSLFVHGVRLNLGVANNFIFVVIVRFP